MRGRIGDDCGRYFPLIGSLALFIFFSNILAPSLVLATDRKLEHHLRLRNRCILLPQLPWSCATVGAYHTPLIQSVHGGDGSHPSAWTDRDCKSPRATIFTWCTSRDQHGWRPRGTWRVHWNGSWLVPIPFFFLGLLVCTIQTFVFVLLSMIYIGLGQDLHHGYDDDHGHEGHGAPAHA